VSGSPPCVLCDARWPVPATETYVEPATGFAFALCAPHKTRLVEGLRRIKGRRLVKAIAARTPRGPKRKRERAQAPEAA
jgi:hypothetical protein